MVDNTKTMSDDWIRDYYGYSRIWDSIFNEHFPHRVKQPDIGATLRHLIEQLKAMANEIDKKDDFEADITLRFNDKIYTVEIKQVASLEEDSENDTDIGDENSSNGA